MDIYWFMSLILILLSIYITSRFFTPKNKLNLPPGPSALPIIGNLHQFKGETLIYKRLHELSKEYGPIIKVRLGQLPIVVVSSAALAKEVMKTQDANFATRPKILVGKHVFHDFSDIGLAPYGDYWRQVRRLATLELFTARRVQSFHRVREEEAANLIKSVAAEAGAGSSVNLTKQIFGLAFYLTTRVIFNKKDVNQGAFIAFAMKMTQVLSGLTTPDLYPSLKWLPSVTGLKGRLEELIQASSSILDPIIQEHISNNKQGKVDQPDFIDVLLKYHKERSEDDGEFSLTINNIKGIVLELFGAGIDTFAVAIEWIMSELLRNQKIMEKAQYEVRQVYQGKEKIDETRLDQLKYLKLVIKESFRLHPPVPLLLPRESIEQCQIQGYDIPPKTRVAVNVWAIGRDANCWTDADVFKPERFEGSTIDYKGTNFELTPFGAGRRMCPGMGLGIANVELTVAALLYHFDWKLPMGIKPEEMDMEETLFGITLMRKNNLYAIPIPYLQGLT